MAERLRAACTAFVIEPYIRFKGEATMFFVEIKAFANMEALFAR